MEPNLNRIPGDQDARVEAVLRQLPQSVSDSSYGLSPAEFGRYGARQPIIALRTRSAERLHDALLAAALAELPGMQDPRDTMVGLAIHFHVAQALGLAPADVFNEVADRLPEGPMATLLRQFGARDDVTLKAFLWRQIDTHDGPDFIPDYS